MNGFGAENIRRAPVRIAPGNGAGVVQVLPVQLVVLLLQFFQRFVLRLQLPFNPPALRVQRGALLRNAPGCFPGGVDSAFQLSFGQLRPFLQLFGLQRVVRPFRPQDFHFLFQLFPGFLLGFPGGAFRQAFPVLLLSGHGFPGLLLFLGADFRFPGLHFVL